MAPTDAQCVLTSFQLQSSKRSSRLLREALFGELRISLAKGPGLSLLESAMEMRVKAEGFLEFLPLSYQPLEIQKTDTNLTTTHSCLPFR